MKVKFDERPDLDSEDIPQAEYDEILELIKVRRCEKKAMLRYSSDSKEYAEAKASSEMLKKEINKRMDMYDKGIVECTTRIPKKFHDTTSDTASDEDKNESHSSNEILKLPESLEEFDRKMMTELAMEHDKAEYENSEGCVINE